MAWYDDARCTMQHRKRSLKDERILSSSERNVLFLCQGRPGLCTVQTRPRSSLALPQAAVQPD